MASLKRLTDRQINSSDRYYMNCSKTCIFEFDCQENCDCEELDRLIDRLGKIEDILGDEYDLDRLRELVEADRAGRCVVLPCHIGDRVFMGTGRNKITGYEEDVCDGFYVGRDGVLQVKAQNHKGNHGTYGVIGRTAELAREAAEAALKGKRDG